MEEERPPINHNNNHMKDCDPMSDLEDEEDDDEDPDDGEGEERGRKPQDDPMDEHLSPAARDLDYPQPRHGPPPQPYRGYRSPSPSDLQMRGLNQNANMYSLVPNPFGQVMYHYMPNFHHQHAGLAASSPGASPAQVQGLNLSSADERRKRNRTFIDPVSEVPRLEQWFAVSTHPSHNLILKYTEELNQMPYRLKFPRLEPKNVQFWFKNRRAKCKRLKMSLYENGPSPSHHQGVYQSAEILRSRD